jgi:transposase
VAAAEPSAAPAAPLVLRTASGHRLELPASAEPRWVAELAAPGLIAPGRVLAVVAPVDMRLGADGLSLKLQVLGVDPLDGSAYLFTNRRGNRLKVLAWNGNGVWLCNGLMISDSQKSPLYS